MLPRTGVGGGLGVGGAALPLDGAPLLPVMSIMCETWYLV